MKSFALISTALAGLALATPTPTVDKRATTFCGQWDSVQTGSYIVYNNLWGQSSGSGSQCTTVNSLSGNNVAWSTSWSWSGGQYNVKSYANAVVQTAAKQISAISSIPTTWKYSYTGSNMVANVAYDLFTSSSASGNSEYEVMVWLAALGGAGPISSSGSPVATPTIAGVSWKLYDGWNGNMHVFSFVAASQVTSFSGDLKAFLSYLTSNQGMSTSQYVTSIGAGTEPFVGSNAVLTTTAYSAVVN
ncbi:putative glycosyl hydrolase family 12 [Rosellinia necatrix]|uniref:Putative glycosyl hydrolase family 12 n=1 Tax=Rosellinia necatrix TaxID=77044 RepID=A0A1S7UKU5_ROSNE|nr:putative glycosyl hydrolase family 12 [Rosellinia necatrix]